MATSKGALIVADRKAIERGADVRALAQEWTAHLATQARAGEIADATRKTYVIGLEKFLTWCARRQSVNDDAVREWIADERAHGRKPATVNTWLAGVRSFFAWAAGARRLSYNPTNGVKGAKRKGTRTKHAREALTDREVLRVLSAPDRKTNEGARDAAILSLMAYTAARTSDLQRADLADLKTKDNRLVLEVQGKGRQEKDEVLVIAHPEAEGALRDWLSVRGDTPGALFVSLSHRSHGARLSARAFRRLKDYFKVAGVRGNKTLHSLRHTAITNAVRHGAPVQKVREMARHANLETTMIYYHETDRIENPAERFITYNEQGGQG